MISSPFVVVLKRAAMTMAYPAEDRQSAEKLAADLVRRPDNPGPLALAVGVYELRAEARATVGVEFEGMAPE